MRTMLGQIHARLNEEVLVYGWVHRVRELGKISFILLRDASGIAQLVVDAGSGNEELTRSASQITL